MEMELQGVLERRAASRIVQRGKGRLGQRSESRLYCRVVSPLRARVFSRFSCNSLLGNIIHKRFDIFPTEDIVAVAL